MSNLEPRKSEAMKCMVRVQRYGHRCEAGCLLTVISSAAPPNCTEHKLSEAAIGNNGKMLKTDHIPPPSFKDGVSRSVTFLHINPHHERKKTKTSQLSMLA